MLMGRPAVVTDTSDLLWRGKWLVARSFCASLAMLVTRLADKVYSASVPNQVDPEVSAAGSEALGLQQASQEVVTTSATLIDAARVKTSIVEGLLARAAVRVGNRELLVDGDIRTRTPSTRLVYVANTWLTNLIAHGRTPDDPRSNKLLLPAGTRSRRPDSVLVSPHLGTLLESLSSEVDLVVVDTIPLANLADASLLSESADEAIVVAQAGSTNRKSLPTAYRPLLPPCERRQPVHTL